MMRVLLCAGAVLIAAFTINSYAESSTLKLWYDKPANKWEEALPLGNGRLGAMVYGGGANRNHSAKRGHILGRRAS